MRLHAYVVLFAVTLGLATLVLVPRWARLAEQQERVVVIAAEVGDLEEEILALRAECARQADDPLTTERFARERMDWRRSGEVVFR